MLGVWNAVSQALKFNSEMALVDTVLRTRDEKYFVGPIMLGFLEQKFGH
jgi:hypothetical protein